MAQGDATIRNQMKALLAAILASDVLKLVLCSGVAPAVDGTVGLADLTQIVADNYVVKTLQNPVVTQIDATDRAKFSADDVEWVSLGAPTAPTTFAALIDDTQAGDTVLQTWTLVTQSNGGNYKLAWNADGILYVA